MKLKNQHINIILQYLFTCILACFCLPASAQVNADFTAVQTSGCAPMLIQFSDLSGGKPTQWKWDLGDGTVSYLQNPSVTYFTPGKYSVKLIAQSSLNTDSVVKENYITIYASPAADFVSLTATTGCTPLPVAFSDKSIPVNGSISKWEWDLGDGKFLYDKNAAYTYTTPGNYNVTLKVTNSYGCVASARKAGYVKANGVNALFGAVDISTCNEAKGYFENLSTGSGSIVYTWAFGDGSSISSLKDTSHLYNSRGSYTVMLHAKNNFGCTDTVTNIIQLAPQLNAGFDADKLNACEAPAIINFTSRYKNGSSYLWDFGDSTTSELESPMHVYSDTGAYNVKLIVADSKGCIDSVKQKGYIHIGKLNLALLNLPDSNCVGYTKKFSATTDVQDSIVNYLWSFGDGQTSTEAMPEHNYNSTGYYDISLIVESASGCRDTAAVQKGIRINTRPAAAFTADIQKACARQLISFTDLSTDGADNWEWHFGDDNIGSEQNPQNLYRDTGYMNVMLIARQGGCADTALIENYIYINPPVARYKAIYKCSDPLSVSFLNTSVGEDAEWNWNFGDGTFSSEENPEHRYAAAGTYKVTLQVINRTTGCTHSVTKELPLYDVESLFTASDTVVCVNEQIQFQSLADTSMISRFTWNFGDGIKLAARDGTIDYAYEKPGIYTVSLAVVNSKNGCRDTLVKTNYIRVNGPYAGFIPNPGTVTVNSSISYTDSSYSDGSSPIQSWQWDYGDGETELLAASPFSHVYKKTGLFYPSLKVTDAAGCSDEFAYPVPVSVTAEQLRFEVAKNVLCPGTSMKFYSQPLNRNYTYTWHFGDGTILNGINPSYAYSREGVYDVKMIITYPGGKQDSLTRTSFITVIAPVADFNLTDTFKNCPPLNVSFTDLSANGIKSIWDFGDGTSTENNNPSHFYSLPGTYPAKLIVTGAGGCKREMQRNIVIKGPSGNLGYDSVSLCHSYTATLTAKSQNAVSYTWDYNDGITAINADTIVTHTYTEAGNYRPKIILVDALGCKVPITGSKEIVIKKAVAAFTVKANTICDSSMAYFSNTSVVENDQLLSYQWDFGDGAISNEISPSHDYTTDGQYTPKLILQTSGGCSDTFIAALPVNIALPPKVNFSTSPNGCTPLSLLVNTTLEQQDAESVRWNWAFGNGNTSKLQNPPAQTYTEAGTYTVYLTASSKNGCKKEISKKIEAYASPVVRTGNDTSICKGITVNLLARGADTFKWNIPANSNASVSVKPDSTSTYIVKGTNNNGCSAYDTVTVAVHQPILLKYKKNEDICKGSKVKLNAEGATAYSWYPAKGLSSNIVASPIAQPDTTTNYRVVGSDNNGCFSDTGYITVTVAPLPYVNAGEDKTITAGSSIDLVPALSGDVVEANWYPTSAIFRNSDNSITVKPEQTTEYILEVKNSKRCLARDKVQVTVLCNGSNVFIPNTFSPNGDGSNEVFFIQGKGGFKIKSFRIFGRWGQEVFYKTNFNANDAASGWDGTFKGVKQPSDVYVYMAEVVCSNGSVFLLKGNVALVR